MNLTPNTIRALVSFIAICRLFGFEPTLFGLYAFYQNQITNGNLGLKVKNNSARTFSAPTNKFDQWNQRNILVIESRFRWSFSKPSNPVPVLVAADSYPKPAASEDLQIALAYYLATFVIEKEQPVFDVSAIINNKPLLIFTGVAPQREGCPYAPRVAIGPQLCDPDWRVHEFYDFEADYKTCMMGTECEPPEWIGLYSVFDKLPNCS